MTRTFLTILLALTFPAMLQAQNIQGKVSDTEGNAIAGVFVSDGIQLVKTADDGTYAMESAKEQDFVFVITPSGYVPVSDDGIAPKFYQRITAPVTEQETHDFTLRKENQDRYSLVLMTDLHITGDSADRRDDLNSYRSTVAPFLDGVVENLRKDGPVYCLNLGDLSHEVFWYRNNFNLRDAYNFIRDCGFPCLMWSVPGNHDNDGAVTTSSTDHDAGHVYRDVFGPEHYAFNIGGDHYVFMDDIVYINTPAAPETRSPGIRGRRNYSYAYTDAELEFLKNDLATLEPGTRVFICSHADVLQTEQTPHLDKTWQADTLQTLAKPFGHLQFYTGHAHRLKFIHGEGRYDALRNYSICALSGNMWTTTPQKALSLHGEDCGVITVKASRDTIIYKMETVNFGEKWLKAYDMNNVAKAYAKSAAARAYFADPNNSGKGVDYSSLKGENITFINWWYRMPGYRMEVEENGRPLKLEKIDSGDPMVFFNYTLPKVDREFFGNMGHDSDHLWGVRRTARKGKLTIRICDKEGRTLYEVTESFPKKFEINKQ